jgi:hypothetical protein
MPETKAVLDSIKTSIDSYGERFDKLQGQVDTIDVRTQRNHVGDVQQPAFVEKLKENEGFQRLLHDRRGRAIITLTGKDAGTFNTSPAGGN